MILYNELRKRNLGDIFKIIGGVIMDLNKRPETMERITTPELAEAFIAEQVAEVQKQVGDKKVLLALSGGVGVLLLQRFLSKQSANSSFVYT